jgi:hypothetical protein
VGAACAAHTKEQLVTLLDVGDAALDRARALLEGRLGAKVGGKRDDVCEVRLFEEGVWHVSRLAGVVWVGEGHRVG